MIDKLLKLVIDTRIFTYWPQHQVITKWTNTSPLQLSILAKILVLVS